MPWPNSTMKGAPMESNKSEESNQPDDQGNIPLKMLLLLVVSIFVIELSLMIILPPFHLGDVGEGLVDAVLLIAIIFPVMYRFIYRPMTTSNSKLRKYEAELRGLNADLEKKVKARTEKLHASENEKLVILKSTSDVILRIDVDGNILYASHAVKAKFGYDESDLIGKNINVLFSVEAQKLLVSGFISTLDSWGGFDLSDSLEVQSMGRDGRSFPVELSISECIVEGCENYVMVVRDVSKRKQAEDKLRVITQSVHDAVIMINGRGIVSYWNNSAERTFGYSEKEAIGVPVTDLILPESNKAQMNRAMVNFSETGKGPLIGATTEVVAVRKDGCEIIVELSLAAIFLDDSWQSVGTVRDITDRKRDMVALQKSKEDAEEATKLKDKFVSLVSHDLKNPLSLMLGFVKLLYSGLKKKGEKELEGFAKIALESGESMNLIIQDILGISRIRSGRMTPKSRFFDPGWIVEKNVRMLRPLADDKNVAIEDMIPPKSRIYGDPVLLEHVIQNLLSNAIKFCDSRDKITIYMPQDEPCTICVADTGTGVNQEIARHIFSEEKTTSLGGTRGEIGTGFGLPICREIMLAHNGEIDFKNNSPRGTIFSLTLPFVSPVALVVDDDQYIRYQFSYYLEQARIKTLVAEGGRQALEMLKTSLPHVIITDVMMAEMDGIELLQELKKMPSTKDIPVIVLTGDTQMETRERAFQNGAADFMNKPVDFVDFLPRVQRLI